MSLKRHMVFSSGHLLNFLLTPGYDFDILPSIAMKLKDLKNAVHFALNGKPRQKTAAPQMAPTVHFKASDFKASNFTLPSTCEDRIFPLLDLPLELVKVIISEVVTIEDPYHTIKLRIVNSKLSLNPRRCAYNNRSRTIR